MTKEEAYATARQNPGVTTNYTAMDGSTHVVTWRPLAPRGDHDVLGLSVATPDRPKGYIYDKPEGGIGIRVYDQNLGSSDWPSLSV